MDNKVLDLYNKLEKRRKPALDYPGDRVTHCYLDYDYSEFHVPAFFEVRGWELVDNVLVISAVNWTIAAGTCTLFINEENINKITIVD